VQSMDVKSNSDIRSINLSPVTFPVPFSGFCLYLLNLFMTKLRIFYFIFDPLLSKHKTKFNIFFWGGPLPFTQNEVQILFYFWIVSPRNLKISLPIGFQKDRKNRGREMATILRDFGLNVVMRLGPFLPLLFYIPGVA